MDEAVALVKEQLNVPDTPQVLFLQGGASMQFAMLTFNFRAKRAQDSTWIRVLGLQKYKEAAGLGSRSRSLF